MSPLGVIISMVIGPAMWLLGTTSHEPSMIQGGPKHLPLEALWGVDMRLYLSLG